MNWSSNKRIGLVLGGGVARGLAHIGVLEVLDGQGIPIDFVVGVSAGAMVGAAYCASGSHEQVRQVSELMRWDRIARPLRPSRGGGFGVTFARLERWVEQSAGVTTFEQLKTPLIVVASDLMSGKPVIFQHGPLAPAVRASSSVPGMVEPLMLDGRLLVDGGVTNNLPISVARQLGADVVIAVNCFPPPRALPRSTLWQGIAALSWLLLRAGDDPHSADVLVEPDLDQVSLLRLASADMRQRGARAMVAELPRLYNSLFS